MHCDTLCPEQNIAVRQGNPKMIFRQPQQYWVVQNTAIRIGDQDIFALANGHL